MIKFPTNHSLNVFRSLVEDCEDILDMDRGTLHSDFCQINDTVLSRGIGVLLLDLPEICSDLEYSLEIGWYNRRFAGPLSKLEGRLPRLFNSIYTRVFHQCGVLLDEPCVTSIRILRQLLRCFKKYKIDCPADRLEKSIDNFNSIEQSELPTPLLSWGSRDLRCDRGWPSLVDLVQRNLRRSEIRSRLSEFDRNWSEARLLSCASFAQGVADSVIRKFVFDFSSRPKHGPGAVSERYSISKFEFPSWNDRLEKFFPFDTYGLINHSFGGEDAEPARFRDDVPAKLLPVHKDYKGPRLIASEPICAQYIQQLILKDLRRNVRHSVLHHCIDFKSQIPSRDLALEASARNDKWSTIDLSSASDRLSCAVVECIFRGKYSYMELLNSARTHQLRISDDLTIDCKKFANQGAAFTFPVQSICYSVLALGCYRYNAPWLRISDAARSLRVFGDDIICRSSSFDDILRLMIALDMVPNQSKSFTHGSFRESCGMDAYNGVSVTPAYIRTICSQRNPTGTKSVVDTANNLYLAGFIRCSSTLLDLLPKDVRQDIPYVPVGSSVWGIVGPNTWARKKRYNRKWQRHEIRVLSLRETAPKIRPDGELRLFQWFIEEPSVDRKYDPFRVISSRVRFSTDWVPVDLLRPSHQN